MARFEHATSQIHWEASGSGDPVLVLPGLMGDVGSHAALVEALSPRFQVIAAEFPGWGKSLPQPRPYHADYYREDAETMLALLAELMVGPAHILGFSDGGEVAILMAAMAPERVRSVLAWGAAGVFNDPDGMTQTIFDNAVDDPLPGLEGLRDYLVTRYGADTARKSLKSFVAAVKAIAARGGDIGYGTADKIACPVLLLIGESDVFVQRADVEALARRIPKGHMLLAEGAEHLVHEDRPEWFEGIVLNWLARN